MYTISECVACMVLTFTLSTLLFGLCIVLLTISRSRCGVQARGRLTEGPVCLVLEKGDKRGVNDQSW
jgi:hypothetical protein